MTAAEYKKAAIRDAFVAGLRSQEIRQRLLEDNVLQLQAAFDKARSLNEAQRNSQAYVASGSSAPDHVAECQVKPGFRPQAQRASSARTCFHCGRGRHPRRNCPAKDFLCYKCGKKGHFAVVCRSAPAFAEPLTVPNQPEPNLLPMEQFDDDNVNISVERGNERH